MKIYNVYVNDTLFCTYLSKEKAEEATKNLSCIRIEEGEVGDINLWELNQTRCLEDLLAQEKETLREYRLAVASLVDGATTIHRVLKAQSNYWTAKQAIRDYFSAV